MPLTPCFPTTTRPLPAQAYPPRIRRTAAMPPAQISNYASNINAQNENRAITEQQSFSVIARLAPQLTPNTNHYAFENGFVVVVALSIGD